MFTLTNDLIVGLAPPERAGAAAGISETAAELGGSLEIEYSAASVSLSIVAD
jgi:MFS transporter, DHA2 family, multidrug resistance protein